MTIQARWLVAGLALTPVAAQESSSPFDAPFLVFDDTTQILATLDLDGDGDRDALGFWGIRSTETKIDPRLNDGTGTFGGGWSMIDPADQTARQHWSLEVGRFDADQRDDFVLRFGNRFTIYLSQGAAAPSVLATWIDPAATGGDAMVVADFDGDGQDDIAADIGDSVRLYRRTSLGFVVASTVAVTSDALLAIDIDGDGDVDLAAGQDGAVQLIRQHSAVLSLGPRITHGVQRGVEPVDTAAGDIDGDGDEDLVVFGSWGRHAVLRHRATGFTVEPQAIGGPATHLVDIDGDGDVDGLCCRSGGGGGAPALYNRTPSTFQIALNDGTGRFETAWTAPSIGAARLAGAVDLDGDGDRDLIAGRTIWFQREGTFAQAPLPVTGLPAAAIWSESRDADGDGDPDVAARGASSNVLDVHTNDGSGQMPPHPLTLPPTPGGGSFIDWANWPGDFDGDGDSDLVVMQWDSQRGSVANPHLLRNVGNGEYEAPVPAGVPGFGNPSPWYPFAGNTIFHDLDADGDIDVMAWGGVVAHNDGNGYFTPGGMAGQIAGRPVEVADFDGDGHVDVVVLRNARVEIAYGRNGVFGGFGQTSLWGSGSDNGSGNARAVDLDGDGDLDLVVQTSAVQVFVNQRNRNYTERVLSGVPSTVDAGHLGIDDYDADGTLDIVTGTIDGPSFVFHRGHGGATFAPGVQQLTWGALAFDFDADGDGDTDFVTSHLVRNATHAGTDVGARQQFGQGSRGLGGFTPLLSATGPFRVGALMTTVVRGGPGGAPAAWVWGLARSNIPNFPLPGIRLYTSPIFLVVSVTLGGANGVPGVGATDITIPVLPAGYGLALGQQFFILDPTAPVGMSHSNAVELRFGR